MAAKGFNPGRPAIPDELPTRLMTTVPLVLLVAVLCYLVMTSFYTVAPHEEAVVLRFGKYHATAPPGLHFKIPLMDSVLKASIEEHSLRLPFGLGPSRPSNIDEEETLMLTGDLNATSVEWTVQWRVTRPDEYLFRFPQVDDTQYVEQVITLVAQTVMNRLVGDYSIGEVLTERRSDIAQAAREDTQRILDGYKCGITIPALQMQRVTPPEKVKPSFDRVNASIQDRDRLESEANQQRNKMLPAARAEKDKLIREAEGYAAKQLATATGEIEALLARYHAFEKAPDVTRQRLYLEAMEKILGSVESKTIIDADLNRVLPLLQLDNGDKP